MPKAENIEDRSLGAIQAPTSKDGVKRPEVPPARSRGPEGPPTFSVTISQQM